MMKVKLKDIASFSKGRQINGDDLLSAGKYAYLNGGIYPSGYWDEYNVATNSIAISEGGNSCGYVNYMQSPFWCGAHCYYLYNLKYPNVKYLYYALKAQQDKIMKLRSGACMPNIKKSDLAEFEFEYNFDNNYQNVVVNQLDNLENLINLRKQQLAKLDELVKSRFIEMFGDVINNDRNWPMATMGDVAEIKIGPFGTLLHKEDYIVGGHALVNPSHIVDGKISVDISLTISDEKYEELSAYHLKLDDIVLGRRGEMGRCAVVREEGLLCGTGSLIIRPNKKLKPYFLQTIISNPTYKKIIEDKAVGVTMMNLNVPIVESLRVPMLPIELQNDFIAFMEQVDKSKFEIQKSLQQLETLKKALMQKYFG